MENLIPTESVDFECWEFMSFSLWDQWHLLLKRHEQCMCVIHVNFAADSDSCASTW